MSYFAVTRHAGPGWIEGRGAFEQPGVSDHAAFMNQLAHDGYVLLAGTLAGSEAGRILVLLIADAQSEREIYDRLAGDPWVLSQVLVTSSVETWTPIVGAERLARVEPSS
jgi:uncharacterized protein YciI